MIDEGVIFVVAEKVVDLACVCEAICDGGIAEDDVDGDELECSKTVCKRIIVCEEMQDGEEVEQVTQ
jgi:hypothetical protein